MKKLSVLAAGAALAAVAAGPAEAGKTLDSIKQRGQLICGVGQGTSGFSRPNNQGVWEGLDVDFCRAVAVSILGDAGKVRYVATTAAQRFPALQSGEVDILSRTTTATLTRDTVNGFNFAPVTFYDGQGFMVPKKLGVKSAKELNGATVCVSPGTTTELNLADYFRAQKMQFKPVVIEKIDEIRSAYFSGRCDVYTTDASGLAALRATDAPNPEDHLILPEIISKEPLAPTIRHGDEEFADVVRWSVYATIEAEELGISSKNLDQMLKSEDPAIKRFLGVTPGNGKALGVDEKFAFNIIKQVGNYGEIFERNVGKGTPLKLERGQNDLWTRGGLQYAQPFR